MKKCSSCKKIKNVLKFHKDKSNIDGLSSICTKCTAMHHRKYYAKHKIQVDAKNETYRKEHPIKTRLQRRKANLKRNFGMTLKDYDNMFKKQKGKCAICKSMKFDGKLKYFNIDHDHKTGKVRGLLCRGCNLGLSNFLDSVKLLRQAIKYVVGNNK